MWPRFGPLPSYAVFYCIGIFLHFVISCIIARRFKLRRRIWIFTGICYAFGMTIGAKVLYDIQKSQFDFSALLSMNHYKQGGLWGGLLAYLILSVPVLLLLSKRKNYSLDLVAMSIPIPFIFAKLSCLSHGCCYGKPCTLPWSITFPEGAPGGAPAGIGLHPTQIYEILLMIFIMIVLIILRSQKWRGTKLLWFVFIYGIGRTVNDMFRGDFSHHRYIGPLTSTQLICLIAVGFSLLMLIIKYTLNKRKETDKSNPVRHLICF